MLITCPRCHGTGDDNGNHEREWHKCGRCKGQGVIHRAPPRPGLPHITKERGHWVVFLEGMSMDNQRDRLRVDPAIAHVRKLREGR